MALRTPLYDWHVAHGGRMVDFAGWDMPVQYSTIVDEHTTVRGAAGVFDISHMGRLSFAGPAALDLIQLVWTNNAASMKDFQARYGLMCNPEGGIHDDVLVYLGEIPCLVYHALDVRREHLGAHGSFHYLTYLPDEVLEPFLLAFLGYEGRVRSNAVQNAEAGGVPNLVEIRGIEKEFHDCLLT